MLSAHPSIATAERTSRRSDWCQNLPSANRYSNTSSAATNRPDILEPALASRPGRIDQAIEVPLPDDAGRRKLVQLYGKALPLADAVVTEAAQRTNGVSAAFIKELMRRIAQASIFRDGGSTVGSDDISEALDDMLFAGGKLNVKLLGGAQEVAP